MTLGQIVLLVAVVAAVACGLYRRRTDGQFGTARRASVTAAAAAQAVVPPGEAPESEPSAVPSVLAETPFAEQLGERATLVQFSSAFCAPCHVTRRILGEVAAVVPGVEHIEIDAEAHLELVRRVGVLRTPTTLVLDPNGVEISRAAGAPRKEQVLAALGNAVTP